jgi:glutamate synthase domain-containing protein 2
MLWFGILLAVALVALGVWDVTQRHHAILRNFPVLGHFRYLLEKVGPELRQYIVTSNDEERPFNRDQRRWVYASSKQQNNYFGFGTDTDLDHSPGHLVVKQSTFPIDEPHAGAPGYDPLHPVPCAKVIGAPRGRARAFRPASIVNISAMSFGSLSAAAVEAINRGVATAGALQNTGEGGIAPHHRHGGDLIWQLGTGYFGARDDGGGFDLARLLDTVQAAPSIRGIEIKLSQGAKPGRGGVLPGAKVTPEIAAIRGIPVGRDCISPAGHSAFRDVDSLLDFVERIAGETGLPVGIKSAVGEDAFWADLATAMEDGQRGVDWIAVDGAEGGTGAAPLVFSDHVALPFRVGFPRVYRHFAQRGLADRVAFMGAGRLGFPAESLFAMAMGCDLIYVAREAMLAIGCIQAQRCHTGHCPAGVATQSPWLMRGLDPTSKAARLANYLVALRKEIMWLTRACGVPHPALVPLDRFELLDDRFGGEAPAALMGYEPGWGELGEVLAGRLR